MASVLEAVKDDIRNQIEAGISQRKLAKKYGVARSTVQEFCKQHDITPPLRLVTPVEDDGEVSEAEILRAELKELRRTDRVVRTIDVANARVLEKIEAALDPAAIKFEPAPKLIEHGSHVQALLLSDTHAGEVVNPDEIDGINAFNWAILEQRMEHIFRSLLSYKDARPYQIEELQIWLLGDMCSGAHVQEIAETNEFPEAEQAKRIGFLLAQFIEQLVPHYPRIVVYGVAGNHPRPAKTPAAKRVFNNWDWMAYQIVEVYLRNYIDEGIVECHFPQSGFVVASIAGLNFLLWHGDGVKSSMVGFPGGGVTRRTKELKNQWAEKGVHLNGTALGHFHQAHVLPGNIIVNGSVKGPDEYALKNFGSCEPPEQLLLTFDPRKHRRTDVSSITP